MLQTPRQKQPLSFASWTAASVSAVSPDCEGEVPSHERWVAPRHQCNVIRCHVIRARVERRGRRGGEEGRWSRGAEVARGGEEAKRRGGGERSERRSKSGEVAGSATLEIPARSRS